MLVFPLFIGTWELVLIILVIVLIFGGKKIPELMKGVGKGVKSFKEGMNEVEEQIPPNLPPPSPMKRPRLNRWQGQAPTGR